jgi:hypothetical protein
MHLRDAEAEGLYLWNVTKQYLFRPGVAGGLIGLGMFYPPCNPLIPHPSVNIGLLASVGRAFYINPQYRRDTAIVSSTVAATATLLSLEGYAAEKYRNTPQGQEEERRAKAEGALIYKHACEHILRPGVLGGLVGAGEFPYIISAFQRLTSFFSQRRYSRRSWLLWLHQLG